MHSDGSISIWFFIGISLLGNGVLILARGCTRFPIPLVKVVLYDLHASVWWGAILTIIGLLYCIFYNPNRA